MRRVNEVNALKSGYCITLGILISLFFLLSSCGAASENALPEAAATVDIIEGNAYYVAPEGSDSNDGSIDRPWATIQHAVNNTGPGDTVYLREGTYVQGASIRGDRGQGGADGQFWTLAGYPGEKAVIKDNSIKIYMTEYVRVKGLTFENGSVGLNSYIKDGWTFPSHTEILDNKITGPQLRYNMIGVIGDDNLVEGNTIIVTGGGDSLDHGIYVMSGSRNIIRNNYISGPRGFGIHIYDEVKQGRSGQIGDVVVEDNVITGSALSGGIIVATGSSGSPLAKNIMIRNNIIYSNGIKGIEVRSNSKDVYIYNNTLYRNGEEDGDGIRIAVCCGSSGFIDGVMMKNNIVDTGNSTGYHVNVGTSASVVSNLVLENNLYWPGPPDLKSISDTSPVAGDPLFVDPAGADFHLRSGSAAIDKGLSLTDVPTDRDGISRPQGSAYDIGAYEYH